MYFGRGAYGIQAAAQRYFSVNAADLTLPQAAMLAGLVQTPANDDPITNPDGAARATQPGAAADARRSATSPTRSWPRSPPQPVAVVPSEPPPNGCVDALTAGFFCDYVQRYLTQALGIPQERLENGGLTIQTTLRPDLQASGDQAVLADLAARRSAGRHLHRRRARHRPRAGDERQPACSATTRTTRPRSR